MHIHIYLTESKIQTHNEFFEAFHDWFTEHNVDADTYGVTSQELATIAVEIAIAYTERHTREVLSGLAAGQKLGWY